MKGLGKGVKSFKDGMEGMEEELKKPSDKTPQADQTEKKVWPPSHTPLFSFFLIFLESIPCIFTFSRKQVFTSAV